MPLEIIVGAVVGAAATSAVTNDKVRNKLRQGLVYGLAGVLVAYDKAATMTSNALASARKAVTVTAEKAAPEAAATETNGTTNPPPS